MAARRVRSGKAVPKDSLLAPIALSPQRWRNMSAGVERFDRWLEDQLVFGLAQLEADPQGSIEPIAARLTDDQLGQAASALRAWIPAIGREEDWTVRVGDDIGYWHLLNRMWRQPQRLDADTFAGLAFAYGYRLQKAKLPELGRGVADHWSCVGVREGNDDALYYRRTYWRGTRPDRAVVQRAFNYGAPLPPAQVSVGDHGEVSMLVYPGTLPTRGILPEGVSLHTGRSKLTHQRPHRHANWRAQSAANEALAQRQPWRRYFPLAVGPLHAAVGQDERGGYWLSMSDAEGHAVRLPLRGAVAKGEAAVGIHARLLATVGAGEFALFGQSGPRGALVCCGVLADGRLQSV